MFEGPATDYAMAQMCLKLMSNILAKWSVVCFSFVVLFINNSFSSLVIVV